MTVYVDDMYLYPMGQYRGMKMSHMIGDDEKELHQMAGRLGLRRAWYQGDHYDVSLSFRQRAILLGAREITLKQCALMCAVRRRTGKLPTPETLEAERIKLRTMPK